MARKLAILFVCLLLVVSVVACGGDPASTPSGSSTTDPSGTASNAQEWKKDLDTLDFGGREFIVTGTVDWTPVEGICEGTDKFVAKIAECEEKYNFKLSFLQQASSTYHDILQASALGGEYIADIWYAMTYNVIPGYAKAGLAYSFDDYNIFDFSNPKWNQGILNLCSWKGKRYGFISDGTYDTYQDLGSGVFFNKDLFEREGLESPYDLYRSGQWTWDKMKELALAATKDFDNDDKVDQWGIAVQGDYYPFLSANNAAIVVKGEDGKYTYGLNDNKAIEALEFFFDLNHSKANAPWLGDWQSSRLNPFMQGKIAMFIYEWWVAFTYLQDGMTEDYGWVPFPIGPSGTEYKLYRSSSNCWVIPVSVPKPDEVMKMYDLISDHEDWANDKKVYESYCQSRVRDDDTMEIFGEMWNSFPNDYDLARNVAQLQQLCRSAIDTAWGGDVSAKTAVDSVQQAAQSLIDEVLNS